MVSTLLLAITFHCLAEDDTNRIDRSPVRIPAASSALVQAHAHNDYEHPRPLLDALAQGFISVEADIWLVGEQLLVAHNREEVTPARTLQALYLDPLRERVRQNGGRVFPNAATFTLLIDVKTAAEPTLASLLELLRGYADILTVFTPTNTTTNALTIVLSGNRAIDVVAAKPMRCVAIDGRFTDLETKTSPHLIPLISENWTQHFTWRGTGAFPEDEKRKLRQWVEQAHGQGRRIRFWAIPDTTAGWHELQSAGVDLINSDDLSGLAKFLRP